MPEILQELIQSVHGLIGAARACFATAVILVLVISALVLMLQVLPALWRCFRKRPRQMHVF